MVSIVLVFNISKYKTNSIEGCRWIWKKRKLVLHIEGFTINQQPILIEGVDEKEKIEPLYLLLKKINR